jgi:hypothetical protein
MDMKITAQTVDVQQEPRLAEANSMQQPVSSFSFQVLSQDLNSRARCGKITTDHGEILTPVFMPVGTQGTVKTLSPQDLEEVGSQIILGKHLNQTGLNYEARQRVERSGGRSL